MELPEISLSGLRILIVDDDPDSLRLLETILGQSGAEAQSCASAAEALGLIIQALPDALVSDVALPDVSGYDLIREIRVLPDEQSSRLPAVALTGYVTSQERIKSLEAGFHLYLSKPVEPKELILVLHHLVSENRPACNFSEGACRQ